MSDEKDGKNEKDDLLEVVRAIEELREKHGTTNKQIFKFVRKRLRNPKEPIKVEKTARTLNKLVDEGVLVKKGRRYMLPNFKSKKYEAGDRNPAMEIKSESEDDESEKDWLSSDDDRPGPSRKKRVTTKKAGKLKNKTERKKRSKKADRSSENLASETERGDRSRSPISNKKSNTAAKDNSEEDNDKCDNLSKSQISVTSEGINEEKSKVEDFRFESSSIPPPSNPQVMNINRKTSCCIINCTNQELDADQEDQILSNMKHERGSYRKHLRRSPSKAKERQHKKKERDEFIEKGRIEKFNRRSYSPEGDELSPRPSLCFSCDSKEM